MRTSFCTIGFQGKKWGADRVLEVPVSEVLPIIAEAGYDGAEIWGPHVHDMGFEELHALRGQLDGLALAAPMLSPYFNFTKSAEHREQSLAEGRRVLERARVLGARGVRCFTGNTRSGDATEEQWDMAVTALQELAELGPEVTWALETHDWNLMDTISGTEQLLARVNRPNVRLILQPSTFGEEWRAATERFAGDAAHMHATNKKDGKGCRLVDGEMDYAWIFAQLRAAGFSGFISIEWMGEDPEGMARAEGPWLREALAGR